MPTLQFKTRLLLTFSFVFILTLACSFGQNSPTPEPGSSPPPAMAAAKTITTSPLTHTPTAPPAVAPTLIPPAPTPTTAETTPPSVELPPPPESVGAASPLASLPEFSDRSITRLQPASFGDVWVISPHLAALWDVSDWVEVVEVPDATIVGVDDLGVVWAVSEDSASIQAWEAGSWQVFGEDEGWLPVGDPWFDANPRLVTDSGGRLWYPTDRDVRMFDGMAWTIYTPTDLDMTPIEDPDDIFHTFRVHILPIEPEVWVTECSNAGPGPIGGKGVRWFNEQAQTWQGRDAGPEDHCASNVAAGPDGSAWVDVHGVLWRRSPQGSWTSYDLPEEPDLFMRPGALLDMTIDPDGQMWAVVLGCGGASCDMELPYRFDTTNPGWLLLGNSPPYDFGLDFALDAGGTVWLFSWGAGIQHASQTTLEETASITARHPLPAGDGRIWFVSPYEGFDWLWVLTP